MKKSLSLIIYKVYKRGFKDGILIEFIHLQWQEKVYEAFGISCLFTFGLMWSDLHLDNNTKVFLGPFKSLFENTYFTVGRMFHDSMQGLFYDIYSA